MRLRIFNPSDGRVIAELGRDHESFSVRSFPRDHRRTGEWVLSMDEFIRHQPMTGYFQIAITPDELRVLRDFLNLVVKD